MPIPVPIPASATAVTSDENTRIESFVSSFIGLTKNGTTGFTVGGRAAVEPTKLPDPLSTNQTDVVPLELSTDKSQLFLRQLGLAVMKALTPADYGTNSSATPGAATINKLAGISAIASGSSTVVITNNLVTTSSHILLTWHADHGAPRWWVVRNAGSFTVTLSASATANTSFSWAVKTALL